MILDRLGVITDEVSDDLITALDWIADHGLKHVELRVVDGVNIADLSDERVREIRREVEARELFVSAIASPLFKCALDPSRPVLYGDTFHQQEESVEQHFDKLNRLADIAKLLGTTFIRIFSFWREEQPELYVDEIVQHLKRAAAEADKAGVVLLLENERFCNGGYAEEVANMVRLTNSPALQALWDPGNEAAGGRSAFPEGYAFMKDVLTHIHLKDVYIGKEGNVHCVPLGSGYVPVIAQLKALMDDGYRGLFTLETRFIPKGGTRMTGTQITLDALRALLVEV